MDRTGEGEGRRGREKGGKSKRRERGVLTELGRGGREEGALDGFGGGWDGVEECSRMENVLLFLFSSSPVTYPLYPLPYLFLLLHPLPPTHIILPNSPLPHRLLLTLSPPVPHFLLFLYRPPLPPLSLPPPCSPLRKYKSSGKKVLDPITLLSHSVIWDSIRLREQEFEWEIFVFLRRAGEGMGAPQIQGVVGWGVYDALPGFRWITF